MEVVVVAGLSDNKLLSKIEPLLLNNNIRRIYLVRRNPINGYEKIKSISPPKWVRGFLPLSEGLRLFATIKLTLKKDVKLILGIHYVMHCIYAGVAGMVAGKKFIFLIAEDPFLYEKNKTFWFFAKRCFRIGVRGNKSKQYLVSKGIDDYKVLIPPNLINFNKIVTATSDKKYDLIFIGAFVTDKRVDILLNAMKLLGKEKPAISLALMGEGPLKNGMIQMAADLGLAHNVIFMDYQKDVFEPIRQSRVLILTSETEGLPMVVIEAMACGVPCIVPDVGDIRDVAIHEYNSLVVKPLDVEGFADAAYRLLSDELLYRKLAENSLKIKQEKAYEYSSETLNKIWQEILNKSN